jgi:hypothetical protein
MHEEFVQLAYAAIALNAADKATISSRFSLRTENRELRTGVEGRWWRREIHRKAEEHVSFEPVRYGKSRG